jgi:hypothetical protein
MFINSLCEGLSVRVVASYLFTKRKTLELSWYALETHPYHYQYSVLSLCAFKVHDNGHWEKSGVMVRLVTQESATWLLPTEATHMQIPIDADHSNMVKFSDNNDRHYITVRDRLYECMRKAPGIIEDHLSKCRDCM